MRNDEFAAMALAVHVRNAVLATLDRHDLIPGDHFPLEWRDLYAEALRGVTETDPNDDPQHRVHNVVARLTSAGTDAGLRP